MATTITSLASALDALALDFNVTSSAGATVGGFCRIDSEYSVVVAVAGNKVSVRSRGDLGGTAIAHGVLAPVVFGVGSDLLPFGSTEVTPVPTDENLVSIGADGPIAVPTRNTTFSITKGSALAGSALPNPPASQDGLEVRFVSLTAFAHVVTLATSTNGLTGGNKTTYTFPAFAGASIHLKALKGAWVQLSTTAVVAT